MDPILSDVALGAPELLPYTPGAEPAAEAEMSGLATPVWVGGGCSHI